MRYFLCGRKLRFWHLWIGLLCFQRVGIADTSIIQLPKQEAAKAYVLMEGSSGIILASHQQDLCVAPASLTKMMTMYLVSKALDAGDIKLTDVVSISQKAATTQGSRMFLLPKSLVKVSDLIQGMLVDSGNDASVALSEYISGDEATFVEQMNKEAKCLGMHHTHFENASGLPHPKHRTTALDLGILAQAIIKHFPKDYHFYKQKSFRFNNITQQNRNMLLKRDSLVDGIKTGETKEARCCIAASAVKQDRRLIAVVMGAESREGRASIAQWLLHQGFNCSSRQKYYRAGQMIAQHRVKNSGFKKISVGLKEDAYVVILNPSERLRLKQRIILQDGLKPPVDKHQLVGEVQWLVDGQCRGKAELISFEAVSESTQWIQRIDRFLSTLYRH